MTQDLANPKSYTDLGLAYRCTYYEW